MISDHLNKAEARVEGLYGALTIDSYQVQEEESDYDNLEARVSTIESLDRIKAETVYKTAQIHISKLQALSKLIEQKNSGDLSQTIATMYSSEIAIVADELDTCFQLLWQHIES